MLRVVVLGALVALGDVGTYWGLVLAPRAAGAAALAATVMLAFA